MFYPCHFLTVHEDDKKLLPNRLLVNIKGGASISLFRMLFLSHYIITANKNAGPIHPCSFFCINTYNTFFKIQLHCKKNFKLFIMRLVYNRTCCFHAFKVNTWPRYRYLNISIFLTCSKCILEISFNDLCSCWHCKTNLL